MCCRPLAPLEWNSLRLSSLTWGLARKLWLRGAILDGVFASLPCRPSSKVTVERCWCENWCLVPTSVTGLRSHQFFESRIFTN